MHAGQLEISEATVRALLEQQFPAWSAQAITALPGAGTVNAIFRIGSELTARFPLQPADPADIERLLLAESAAAAELVGRTRVATPTPVAIGRPGFGYPLRWSVQTWVPGHPADATVADSVAFAIDLADFVLDVRALPVKGRRFTGSGRGGHLPDHDYWMATCLEHSVGLVDVEAVRRRWADLRQLPRTGPDVMSHGDLIEGNVLVADGRLVGVIDVGGLGPADPALDLVAAWHLLEAGPRTEFRRLLGSDDLEWERGRAWALEQAMGLVWYYIETNPAMHRMGMTTLDRILADPA